MNLIMNHFLSFYVKKNIALKILKKKKNVTKNINYLFIP